MSCYRTFLVYSLLKGADEQNISLEERNSMIEATEFESGTHWEWNRLRARNGSYPQQSVVNVESFLPHDRWASLRTDGSGILPIIEETPPISSNNEFLSSMDKWDLVYGLHAANRRGDVVNVETPADRWSWCGDPAFSPRICLKKRMSILNHFGG